MDARVIPGLDPGTGHDDLHFQIKPLTVMTGHDDLFSVRPLTVMAGLDPAIHRSAPTVGFNDRR
jgi:hypothetical protein